MLRARFIIHASGCEFVFQTGFLILSNFGGQILPRSDLFVLDFASLAGKDLVGGGGSTVPFLHRLLVLDLAGYLVRYPWLLCRNRCLRRVWFVRGRGLSGRPCAAH